MSCSTRLCVDITVTSSAPPPAAAAQSRRGARRLGLRASFGALLLAAPILAGAGPAWAAEYFVDGQAGDDLAAGDAAAPWKSLARAAEMQPGDVVNVRPGTYDVGESFVIKGGGSADAYVVYRAATPGQRPVLTNSTGNAAVVRVNVPYVELRGFEIKDSRRFGVQLSAAHHARIVDNVVHGGQSAGVWSSGLQGRVGAPIVGVLVKDNVFYNNGRKNENGVLSGGWTGAITGQNTEDLRVVGNVVYENWGEGIVFNLTRGSVARGNVVYDNWSAQMYMDNAQDSTFERNFVYCTGNPAFNRVINGTPRQASGIQFANESYDDAAMPLDDVKIVNNIVVGGFASFYYGNYEAGGGLKDTLVANNTFYGPTDRLLSIDADAHSATFLNNAFHAGAGKGLVRVGKTATSTLPAFHHNAWRGVGNRGSAAGVGDVLAEPGFANPGAHTTEAYQISALSPLVGAGAPHAAVTVDFWGGARGETNDIGAHQVGAPAPAEEVSFARASWKALQAGNTDAATHARHAGGCQMATNARPGVLGPLLVMGLALAGRLRRRVAAR
jgi:hypothetical protein